MKPLNSGYLRALKNLSVIERCPLWGGNLKKIITFVTCSLFGMSAIGRFHCNYKNTRTRKIIPYRTILITGLWLVRKVFYYEYVKQEKCIYFMPDTPLLLLFIFFSNARFFNFLFFKYIQSAERCISPPLLDIPPFFKKKNSPPFWQPSWENCRFYDDIMESGRLKTNIKPWKPIAYRNCVS